MDSWRLLELEYPDAASNLALEEAVARQVGEGRSVPTLRLWRSRNAAVIGENQSANAELKLDACKNLGVEVVRRFTGGGAVYHDLGNLNYSICTPKRTPSDPESQQAVFRKGVDCAALCLRTLGLESSKVPINTITVRGRKVSGGAGAIRWGVIFYHGSILVRTNLEIVWRILRWEDAPAPHALVRSIRLPVTSMKEELKKEISVEEVEGALKDAFTKTFMVSLAPGSATEQELQMTSAMAEEKYGSEQWNLKI